MSRRSPTENSEKKTLTKSTGRRKHSENVSESEASRDIKTEEEKLRGIWSRAMALRGLKKVVSVSLEAAKVPTVDENGEVKEIKFNPSAANAATKAIETANKMLGYNLPDEEEDGEDEGEIIVSFDCPREYSE